MKRMLLVTLLLLGLAGCAASDMYIPYTDQIPSAKSKDYPITIYSVSEKVPSSQSYRIIGKVDVHGYIGDGVTQEMLIRKARKIARAKGADAIINSVTQMKPYGGAYVVPSYAGYRLYSAYSDTFLRFTGELIVFMPDVDKK